MIFVLPILRQFAEFSATWQHWMGKGRKGGGKGGPKRWYDIQLQMGSTHLYSDSKDFIVL